MPMQILNTAVAGIMVLASACGVVRPWGPFESRFRALSALVFYVLAYFALRAAIPMIVSAQNPDALLDGVAAPLSLIVVYILISFIYPLWPFNSRRNTGTGFLSLAVLFLTTIFVLAPYNPDQSKDIDFAKIGEPTQAKYFLIISCLVVLYFLFAVFARLRPSGSVSSRMKSPKKEGDETEKSKNKNSKSASSEGNLAEREPTENLSEHLDPLSLSKEIEKEGTTNSENRENDEIAKFANDVVYLSTQRKDTPFKAWYENLEVEQKSQMGDIGLLANKALEIYHGQKGLKLFRERGIANLVDYDINRTLGMVVGKNVVRELWESYSDPDSEKASISKIEAEAKRLFDLREQLSGLVFSRNSADKDSVYYKSLEADISVVAAQLQAAEIAWAMKKK